MAEAVCVSTVVNLVAAAGYDSLSQERTVVEQG
jgi:hypothetical protein